MSLGAKKYRELVSQCGSEWSRVQGSSGYHYAPIAAIVGLMLSRQEAQVAPLLKAAKDAIGNISPTWTFGRALWDAIAAYEAAQADEPEPTLAEAVEAMLARGDLRDRPCMFVDAEKVDAVRAALARERAR
jgi:hypothetical protein